MTALAGGRELSFPGLRVIVESGQVEPVEHKSSVVSLLAGDRSRVESLLPEAAGYEIERRDLHRHFRVFTAQRKYQEIPMWDLISPEEKARFLRAARHWQKRYDNIQNSATRDCHIRFVYEKTGDQASMFGFTARRWLISSRYMHDEKYGENWTEAIADSWYLDSDQVKLRYSAFSEKLVHYAFSYATSGDERVIIEHVGERPTGLCALSETRTHSHHKGLSGEAIDHKTVAVSKITSLTEETVPESLFAIPVGFKKMPVYPSRFTMARLELRRSLRRVLRKNLRINNIHMRSKHMLLLPVLLAVVISGLAAQTAAAAESRASHACHGLRAHVLQHHDIYNEDDVQIELVLQNKSADCRDTAPESWHLFIDGKTTWRSDMIFGNGINAAGGYKVLKAGQAFDSYRSLSLYDFFPRPHTHKLYWKGKYFKSNTISIAPPAIK